MLSWSLPVTSALYRQLLLHGRILVNLIIAIVWRDALLGVVNIEPYS